MKTKKLLMSATKILLLIGGIACLVSLFGMQIFLGKKAFNYFFLAGLISAIIFSIGTITFSIYCLRKTIDLNRLSDSILAKYTKKPKSEEMSEKKTSADDERTRQLFGQLTTPGPIPWPCK